MPPGFESSARVIHVEKPKRLAKNKYFNLALGEYQVVKSSVGSFATEKTDYTIAVEESKDSWIDLLLQRKLLPETEVSESFGKASSREYEFSIALNNKSRVKTKCNLAITDVVEEKTKKSFLGVSNKKPSYGAYAYEAWVQTIHYCDISTQHSNARLSVLHINGKKPVYDFETDAQNYQFAPMYNLTSPMYKRFEDAPTISNENNEILDAPKIFGNVPMPPIGVTVFHENHPVAIVSLFNENNTIWLANNLEVNETELLLGISHSLILSSWLDNN